MLNKLEEKELKYIGGIAKNRKVQELKQGKKEPEKRIDEVAKSKEMVDLTMGLFSKFRVNGTIDLLVDQ